MAISVSKASRPGHRNLLVFPLNNLIGLVCTFGTRPWQIFLLHIILCIVSQQFVLWASLYRNPEILGFKGDDNNFVSGQQFFTWIITPCYLWGAFESWNQKHNSNSYLKDIHVNSKLQMAKKGKYF